jgi:hypothetical protein
MVIAGFNEAERLAKIGSRRTGFGKVEDKKTKNTFATKSVWESIKDENRRYYRCSEKWLK